VFHEHRGTIGKTFSEDYIEGVLKKNFLLFCWKNIHEPARLAANFFFTFAGAVLSAFFGDSPERSNSAGICRAFIQLPSALASRWRAKRLAVITDTEAFLRPLGGYFRDRFEKVESDPGKLRVLFVSPYPIFPPIHGGAVFMFQTLAALKTLTEVHLIALLDYPHELEAHQVFKQICASSEFLVRPEGRQTGFSAITPHSISEFSNSDVEWVIQRQIYTKRIDVIQLEYLPMGQYAGEYCQLACVLFEHDIYFQSIARQLPGMNPGKRPVAFFEYLRALRYELRLLPELDRIQVCSRENRMVLESFLPGLAGRIDDDLRAGIDVSNYSFRPSGREPDTILFLGSFRHLPNTEALTWFVRQVFPLVLAKRPRAKLILVGSDPPPRHFLSEDSPNIEMRGFVDDIREPLSRYSVFVCPILSGSGVRVKLLEAFASGIPCVSTRLGAEGLAHVDGDPCALADTPSDFAVKIIDLLENSENAIDMANKAHRAVMERDMGRMTAKLIESYRTVLRDKRPTAVEPHLVQSR
jgi:glycosyltransferase involved in cell wall biosynthesis